MAATASRSGKFSKSATVETDDPENARIILTITANVLVELDFEVNQIRLKDIEVGKEQIQTIAFVAKEPSKVKFGEVKSSNEEARVKMVKGADGAWSLEVKFTPTKVGHATAKIEVTLTEPEPKTLVVFLTSTVRGDIRAMPDRIILQTGLEGVELKRSVRLQADEITFKVKKMVEKEGYLDLEMEETQPGKSYLIHVKLSEKGAKTERFVTNIVITTSSKKQPVIEIPVHVKPKPTQGPGPKNPIKIKPEALQPLKK
jgi:hypothetical protein